MKVVNSIEDYKIIPFMPSVFLYPYFLDRFIFNLRVVWLVLFIPCFIDIHAFNANSVDPDQSSAFS